MVAFLRTTPIHWMKFSLIALSSIALLAHGLLLYFGVFEHGFIDLSFVNVLSLVAWWVILLVTVFYIFANQWLLLVIFVPVALFALFLNKWAQTSVITSTFGFGASLHIVLSIISYSLLLIATAQGLLLKLQDKGLRQKSVIRWLFVMPSVDKMEGLLLQIVKTGFFLLSLSVVTGLISLEGVHQSNLSHVFFALTSWAIFAGILLFHWRYNWRAIKFVHWIIIGFFGLFADYFVLTAVLGLF